ncbi:MAG: hypothetical protein MUO77_03930 [Anaerolineales bacterium]|nr:hypothetical protein [Anaerolineales bacterium]
MNKNHKTSRLIMIFVFLLVWGTSSCAAENSPYPQAWIDYPTEGMSVPIGTTITVTSHGFARDGIAEFVLSVNGEAYRRDVPAVPGTDFAKIQQAWVATEAGTFTLQVHVYDTKGQASNFASVTIEVAGNVDLIPVVPVITDTPTSVITNTPTPTSVITVTPLPPSSSMQFYSYPPEIGAGSCATIYWNVENAQRVIFGGVDQPFNGSYEACLCEDERYTLTVIHLDGTEERSTVNVNVTGSCVTAPPPPPAVDTTPPPVPSPSAPADGAILSCTATQTLIWSPVNDDSGIAGYLVKLEVEIKAGQWQSAGGQQVSGTQVSFPVNCGGHYRWMVRAQDSAGNFSNWSAPSNFAINLN